MIDPIKTISRRSLMLGSAAAALAGTSAAAWRWTSPRRPGPPPDVSEEDLRELRLPPEPGPDEALERLVNGNKCYVAEYHEIGDQRRNLVRRREIADRQNPFALILGCSDSRVAPEVLFDAGLGDLFVVRVAGNFIDPRCFSVIGSVEYAVEELKVPLIMVLGHEGCGAVKAAVRVVREEVELPGSIDMIADSIRPVVKDVANSPGDLVANAVAANVRHGVNWLTTSATMLKGPLDDGRLKVVGATYELKSGLVRIVA
jgi:carbonic anhydrase